MRISDWSSDVCSSDLVGEVGVLVVQFAVDRPVRGEELADADGAERSIVRQAAGVLEVVADAAGQVPAVVKLLRIGGLHEAAAGEQREIGRASLGKGGVSPGRSGWSAAQ